MLILQVSNSYNLKYVKRNQNVAIHIIKRNSDNDLELIGVYCGRNIKTTTIAGDVKISLAKNVIPNENDRQTIINAILKTLDAGFRSVVDYVSIADGKPEKRTATILKHTDDIALIIIRRKEMENLEEKKSK